MMAQFLEIKAEYPNALLFYRMGDFYEMFFDDAVMAAQALDIALTKRGKHQGQDIPMCGVPVHAAENYLLTLIRKGFRVGVCEQLEDPAEAKKRGSKSVVKRGVVRLVTPGTLTEDSLLDARQHNFLCAFASIRDSAALAWVDVSTGDFHVQSCPTVGLSPLLARLAPREVLVGDSPDNWLRDTIEETGAAVTELARASFDSTAAGDRLTGLFGVKSLDAFGNFARVELAAMGAIVDYLHITQKGKLPLLKPPVAEATDTSMRIDAATRRNLELTRTISGDRTGALLSVIDKTITGSGARLLETRLNNPSRHLGTVRGRLDAVSFFVDNQQVKNDLRETLRKTPDMDRALTRLSLERAGPRDIAAIRDGLTSAQAIFDLIGAHDLPDLVADARQALAGHGNLIGFLNERLVEEPPLLARDGGFTASGYRADLDEARTLRDEGRKVILGLQKDYAELAGVTALKIKHNNVLGYFIETPATHAPKMLAAPLSDTFIHRQTTANAVRFTTLELSELETKILNAGGRALEIEREVYSELSEQIVSQGAEIGQAAKSIAELDLQAALAELALSEDWTRPAVSDDRRFKITAGRHPVVDAALRKQASGSFVANDCDLSDAQDSKRLWLLTGPNMAGKSTFLRQNALIAVLAQMGSYVPADQAEIGLVSQLFSRVGASDDLARGRSTFMVEMVETAAILNQADQNALVILDEIGRGTATYDGLSIAWATLEHLHEGNKCRALFATHYHELTQLSSKLDHLMNATIAVREWEGDIIFLHEVRQGAADRSYGVQVAQLAGLPASVVERARVVLEALEKGDREDGNKAKTLFEDLPLFAVKPQAPPQPVKQSKVEEILGEVLPDDLSPKEALSLVYQLKETLGS
ncbi:DNA mismatch repair protein MutS [Neptunicoccus cionae]|uniref:DNA mismatch repair protein MutS n=1 Tax=Neptunicoccus cionae TaxID=2035344 RepID=A0A916VQ76_9RHOB|nr:DNA mismatch repair protein MutS [Amylibacter cionae]GGA18830.1 DNA mismatch repair protein MutS [Amylibacter cionae]